VISLLDLACMVHACLYLVILLSLARVLQGLTVIFIVSYRIKWIHQDYMIELFSCVISLLDLACMVHACLYLIILLSLERVLRGVAVIFNVSLPFLYSHVVMGSLLFG